MPKGVVWRQEDAFFACIGGGDPTRQQGPVDRARTRCSTGSWTRRSCSCRWRRSCTRPASGPRCRGCSPAARSCCCRARSTPVEVWRTVEREGVNLMTVVGDPVVRPLVDAWVREGPVRRVDAVLDRLGRRAADAVAQGPAHRHRAQRGGGRRLRLVGDRAPRARSGVEAGASRRWRHRASRPTRRTTVLDEDTRRPVEPGSEVVGRVALRGRIPLGYYNAPEKTAETFVEIDGVRWVLTGDMATIERRRHHPPARPGLGVHQHRRREGLPRRGRGRAQGPPGGVRRAS